MRIDPRACGSQSAHIPHEYLATVQIHYTGDVATEHQQKWCPGIMPIWPCGLPALHNNHQVGHTDRPGDFYCPGTLTPPTDMIGPWYAHAVIEHLAKEAADAAGTVSDH